MNKFWKTVLASALGFLIMNILFVMFLVSVVSGLASSATSGKSGATFVPDNAILNIDFGTMTLAEQSMEADPFGNISLSLGGISAGAPLESVGILDAVKALEIAANDPKIKCVYLRPDNASNLSLLEEFRSALEDFRKSGKAVYAYVESGSNAGYYLASVADRIYMSEYHGGMVTLVGLSGTLMYYKDLLDRLGVNIQLIRHGKYKSAGEPYIRSTASAENLEQQRAYIQSTWNEMVAPMAARCGKTAEEFNAMLDNLVLTDAQAFVDNGLVDELVSMNGMKEKLCTMTGAEKYSQVQSISFADYTALSVKPDLKSKEGIAIIYADGEIVDGRGSEEVAGKYFADLVDKVRKDDSIKAVVLRVNSPGGSVVAASQIKDAIDALQAEKPVIASYGSYAASGGYWISACCDRVFSDATTLTGSIGVFGMIPDVSKTVKNLAHINLYSINTNKHSDMYSLMHTLTPEETAYIQVDIENIYKQFTSIVAEGRKMPVERVDDLGQGRVWVGRDALANGLVDEIGGLKDALEYAAKEAGLSTYFVNSYPKIASPVESMLASLQPDTEQYLVELGVSKETVSAVRSFVSLKTPAVYARLPYSIEIR